MSTKIPSFKLANTIEVPQLGLGVFLVEDEQELTQSVLAAIKHGYRHIDTAAIYHNEPLVGEALQTSGIPRSELFLTSKVWNDAITYEDTIAAFETTLKKLKTDYLDLYLIHWPSEGYFEKWRALEALYEEGKIRAIGVSNFEINHLEQLMQEAKIKPMINQVETNPYFQQTELHDYLVKEGIQHEAWGPLGQGKGTVLEDNVIQELAEKHQKTPAQIILRWHLDRQVIAIPKSIHETRIQENREIFDFHLSKEDLAKMASIDKNQRGGADPTDDAWLAETTKMSLSE
ncbi:aldo/keto reductase [Carnobacterium divergens]|uniref:aldo/keto reductase n=1 Tax=Carnobacterium divergens TaxID=2748 RepID=UPI001072CDDB|nr:aldo/keto reductase [Carnobacterium divergens]TFI72099.1 aldo/keto reductase [Carnobacterium divergens]